MQKITIDPITRLEGHGRIDLFLDDEGEVENAYFVVPEFRGFEQFCVGRPVEEMPRLTSRICGVCPEAHHMASTKALDDLFQMQPSPAVAKLRELFYMAFFVTDHATHFFALGGPDFILGPHAPAAQRNILGVVHKVGVEIGGAVIACRQRNHHVIETLGGRSVHPVAGLPGGWSRAISDEERNEFLQIAKENVEFAQFSLELFEGLVLDNEVYRGLLRCDEYTHHTYSMGMVDENNQVNFYDGQIRVVDPDGQEFARYHPRQYRDNVAEAVAPWTYLKFPYLKQVGWQGMVEGADSGVYTATPLSRLNVSDGLATPLAQAAYEKMYETLDCRRLNGRYEPVHNRLVTHWARLIEMLYAAERMQELAEDPEILDPDVRPVVSNTPREGVGCVEAPRGTLTHHYWTDENGIVEKVNLIVGTTNNYAPIAMSVKKVAQAVIGNGVEISQGILNEIEMAFRAYDPCFGCATHTLPGQMPLEVLIHDSSGSVVDRLAQNMPEK